MKKFLLLALAAFALAACNDDDTPAEFVQGDNTIAVFENDRLVFYDYDVFWDYSETYTDPYGVTCIDLYMNKTRFVQNMPALDMEVPGIPIHLTPAGFEFDLRQAVPYYRGEPMPRYTLYDLEGTLARIKAATQGIYSNTNTRKESAAAGVKTLCSAAYMAASVALL